MYTMSPGTYYIGDLCYVFPDDEWSEVCELMTKDDFENGQHTTASGKEFVYSSTAYGDGCYLDGGGREYGVDAGLIGAMKMDFIPEELKDEAKRLGHIFTFDESFECEFEDGLLMFGAVHIDTDPEDDEDDEDWDEEEDEEDADDE